MIVVMFLLVGLVFFVRYRRHRANRLAGLTSERPVFQVEPPPGRFGRSLKDERL